MAGSEDLQYPIGRFRWSADGGSEARRKWVGEIANMPQEFRSAVAGLTDEQFDTPYRPGGWTVRQLVHHVPESHMNAYLRLKWALTEEQPAIKSYDEARWAELPEARSGPVEPSLRLLDALHERWVTAWNGLSDSEWRRTLRHPEIGSMSVEHLAALYAWHGRHHVAHIRALRKRSGWGE